MFNLKELITILGALDDYRNNHIPFEEKPEVDKLCEKIFDEYKKICNSEAPTPSKEYSFETGV